MAFIDYLKDRLEDEKYLNFIRQLSCCVSERTEGIEAHHPYVGGTGTK